MNLCYIYVNQLCMCYVFSLRRRFKTYLNNSCQIFSLLNCVIFFPRKYNACERLRENILNTRSYLLIIQMHSHKIEQASSLVQFQIGPIQDQFYPVSKHYQITNMPHLPHQGPFLVALLQCQRKTRSLKIDVFPGQNKMKISTLNKTFQFTFIMFFFLFFLKESKYFVSAFQIIT